MILAARRTPSWRRKHWFTGGSPLEGGSLFICGTNEEFICESNEEFIWGDHERMMILQERHTNGTGHGDIPASDVRQTRTWGILHSGIRRPYHLDYTITFP